MKKMMIRAALALVALSILMTAFAGLALAETGYVQATGRVNVRTGPGLEYRSLGTVEKGGRLTYLEEAAADDRGVVWYRVQYDFASDGWISSKYARLENYTERVKAVNGQTYIRSAGNLNGRGLGILPKGASATYLNQSTVDDRGVAWYYISYDGIEGWVSSRYTRLGSGSTGAAPAPSYTRKVTATGGKTNIRSAGNLYGEVKTVLPKGASATYLENSTTDDRGVVWYKVKYDGVTGWVSSRYTQLGSGSGSTGAAPAPSYTRKVVATGGKSNIRSEGSLYGDVKTVFPKGASATYLENSTTDDRGVVWYKIKYDGVTGWVSSRYTTLR